MCTLSKLKFAKYPPPTLLGHPMFRLSHFILFQITLRQGDIPPSVQGIYIIGSGHLTFQKHAFYNLPSLSTLFVDLQHEGELNVDNNGLELQNKSDQFFLKIENAKVVVFANSALAGFWTDAATIKLQIIQSLYIQQNSFSFSSKGYGPSLIMERVDGLHLAPYALRAPIRSLEMSSVYMSKCLNGSFDGTIFNMKMNHVKIDFVRKGCIETSGMSKLSIDSSTIETVRSQGFSGKIRGVKIQDTAVAKIEQNGFSLQVATLRIENCQFDDLMTSGLSATANESINLEAVNVTTLRKHALIGLQVLNNNVGHRYALNIHNFNIAHAEQESLAFSEQTKLRLVGNLNVPVPDPRICPTERWVRWLVGKPGRQQLSDAYGKVLGKVKSSSPCPASADAVTLQSSDARTTPIPDVPYGNEVTTLEPPLLDDTTYPPRASHMTPAPQQTEVDGDDNLPGDGGVASPKTTPVTATASDQELNTPEADTSTPPQNEGGTTSNEDQLSAGEIVAFVLGIVLAAAVFLGMVYWFVTRCVCTKDGEPDKKQPDAPTENEPLSQHPDAANG